MEQPMRCKMILSISDSPQGATWKLFWRYFAFDVVERSHESPLRNWIATTKGSAVMLVLFLCQGRGFVRRLRIIFYFSAGHHKVILLVILTVSIWHCREKSPYLNGRGDFSLLILLQKFLCNVQIPCIALDKGHHQIFHLSQSISAKDFCIGQTTPRMQICFHLWPQVTAQ